MKDEEWRPIPGYEGYYEVSSYGRVRSVDREVKHWRGGMLKRQGEMKKLSPLHGFRYYLVHLCKDGRPRRFTVHRLVAEAFIPNPENKPCINHRDGDVHNNHVDNLEWCTPKENMTHARESGLFDGVVMGARLDQKQHEEIRVSSKTQKELSIEYGVSIQTIGKIKRQIKRQIQ